MSLSNLKVAIVHDWLTSRGGAEKVVLSIHELFPDAPIYTSAYNKSAFPDYANCDVRTTFIQHIPLLKYKHKLAFLLRIPAFYALDLSDYDLVISSTTAEAKGVKTKKKDGSGALHICYCNTPTRYYWSGYDQYYNEPGFGFFNPAVRLLLKLSVGILRKIDLKLAARPDVYIGNSSEVSNRIKKYYKKDSYTVFPSVETDRFKAGPANERKHYIIAGRQVPYKRVDLAIEACNQLNAPLVVVGNGTEHEKLKKLAGHTVTFITNADDKKLADLYAKSKALIYPAEEDAGIVPVEAMAAGTPVIAFNKGGSLDTVILNKTGLLFNEQTSESLTEAMKKSESISWNHQEIATHAQQFSKEAFKQKLTEIIEKELKKRG